MIVFLDLLYFVVCVVLTSPKPTMVVFFIFV